MGDIGGGYDSKFLVSTFKISTPWIMTNFLIYSQNQQIHYYSGKLKMFRNYHKIQEQPQQ